MEDQKRIIGDTAVVTFISINNKQVRGKVDSGATTSSLHATNISVNGNRVTFNCEHLSDNTITMDIEGQQDVHTADNGADRRPTVKLNINVEGVDMKDVLFNLNDRSEMDNPLLIGQNVLKPGGFVIDVSKNNPDDSKIEPEPNTSDIRNEQHVIDALRVLRESNVTFDQIINFFKTEAVRNLKDD